VNRCVVARTGRPIGDLVKATISEQQFIIEQLEHYISGQRD
jgi:hypothetical protein